MKSDNLLRPEATLNATGPARQRLGALLLGLVSAIILLYLTREHLVFDFNEAAMGEATSGLWGEAATAGQVHCDGGVEAVPCAQAYEAAGRPPAWLWVGNSQLHGVNRYTDGEKSASMALHDRLRPHGVYLVTNSLPNLTTAELVTLVHGVGRHYDLKKVIIPVVLNGLRGGSVRESQWPLLREPETVARLEASHTATYLRSIIAQANAGGVTPEGEKEFAHVVEDRLNAEIGQFWPLWDDREKLRSLANYAYHVGRHKLFGVSAQSKRPLLGSGYESQMKLLGALLDDLRLAGIEAFVYVPPYRQDVAGPYIAAEYARFKQELGELATSRGAGFAIIDDVVPGPDWGMVRDYLFGTEDYDFMHFTADGHSRLAAALYRELKPQR